MVRCASERDRLSNRWFSSCSSSRPEMVRGEGLGDEARQVMGSARPRPRSRASSHLFCIACGSTGPSSIGRRRKLLPSKQNTEILPNGGKRCPLPERGDGEFVRFFASARKADRDCNILARRVGSSSGFAFRLKHADSVEDRQQEGHQSRRLYSYARGSQPGTDLRGRKILGIAFNLD
jgi:hypothetical protein